MASDDIVRRTVQAWLQSALDDTGRRGLPELGPLLESLAESTIALRTADWSDEVTGLDVPDDRGPASPPVAGKGGGGPR